MARAPLAAPPAHRILKVARTIADLGTLDCVPAKHYAEAGAVSQPEPQLLELKGGIRQASPVHLKVSEAAVRS